MALKIEAQGLFWNAIWFAAGSGLPLVHVFNGILNWILSLFSNFNNFLKSDCWQKLENLNKTQTQSTLNSIITHVKLRKVTKPYSSETLFFWWVFHVLQSKLKFMALLKTICLTLHFGNLQY